MKYELGVRDWCERAVRYQPRHSTVGLFTDGNGWLRFGRRGVVMSLGPLFPPFSTLSGRGLVHDLPFLLSLLIYPPHLSLLLLSASSPSLSSSFLPSSRRPLLEVTG